MAGFSIYTRKRKHGKPVYYAQFKTTDGNWSTAKSTGCTTRRDAEQWCEDFLNSKGYFISESEIKFKNFSKDFFNWNNSWATDKRVRGLRISPRHCMERTDLLNTHLIPVIGNINLSDIDRGVIKTLRNDLFNEGYSGSTINHILSTLKAILEAAEEKSLIKYIPRIDRAACNSKQKGILTIEEVRELFSVHWYDYRGYVGNLLASTTGLRLGEIQALTLEDIHLDCGYINVRRSWDVRLKKHNQTTKTGRSRNIFIPVIVQGEIKKLIELNSNRENPNSFLFFGGKKSPALPTDVGVFSRSLFMAMERIGIDKEERLKRNITFHSWRHWFNSLLINARIPLQKIQSITGHLTAEMTQHYYHLDDMKDVQQIQEQLFPPNN